jgi:hypothetical protein
VKRSVVKVAQVALSEVRVPLPVTPATEATVASGTSNRIGRSWPEIGIAGISIAQASAVTATAVPF